MTEKKAEAPVQEPVKKERNWRSILPAASGAGAGS